MKKNKQFMNKSPREIADQLHQDPLEVPLDLAVEENTALGMTVSILNSDPEAVGKLLTLSNVLVRLSDAGAHVDQHCEAGVPAYILHEGVRKRQLLSMEEAGRRIRSELADLMGLKTKGRIAPGMEADLVLFDLATVKQLPAE